MSTSVVVGLCTFRRNSQLTVLLQTLTGLSVGPLADLEVTLLVVDDDPAGGAEAVVREIGARYEGDLRYRHAGSANLSTARNTVIEEGLASGADWLVFIDDDCVPDEEWLRHLLDVQSRTDADMVTGRAIYRADAGAPSWLVDEPFLDVPVYEDGMEPPFGNTQSVLLSTRFLRDSGVRFRPALGLTGGEDMTFYADARAHGAALRYSAKSIVYELLTPSRERLGYHLHRQFWLGNNMAVINRQTRGEAMLRLLLRGLKRVVVSLLQPAVRLGTGRPAQVRWSIAFALQGIGLVSGVLGVQVRHRS